jgi:uncharacterized protein YjbI with pentapeptide repeats
MANADHLERLKLGSGDWNRWRSTSPSTMPDLSGAGIGGLNLTDYDLSGANLRGAEFRDVVFGNCNLLRADLRQTDLQDVDLSGVRGPLFPQQLAGANLAGATPPKDLKDLADGLDAARSISDSAQKLFLLMIAACLYSWLTIATTSDVHLITNDVSSPLPIIQTNVPIVGFYIVAPLLLLAVYIYFQVTLQKFFDVVSSMPAVFPDGTPLYANSDPLLLSDFLRAHIFRLRRDRPIHSYIQQWVAFILAWCTIPYTLALFWLRYLSRHEVLGTALHGSCLLLSIAGAIYFHSLAVATLGGEFRDPLALKVSRGHHGTWRSVAALSAFVMLVVLISLGSLYGVRYGVAGRDWWPQARPSQGGVAALDPRRWAPSLLQDFGLSPFADLRGVNLAARSGEDGKSRDGVEELARGYRLGAIDLRYADLRGASLRGVVLSGAALEWSDLLAADLAASELSLADMRNADLLGAHLQGADLRGALLSRANLNQTDFAGADVEFADFRGSLGLTGEEIKKARNWCNAFYDSEMLAALGLEQDNGARVSKWRSYQEDLTKDYAGAAESARLEALSRLSPSMTTQTLELIGGLNDPTAGSSDEDADLQNQARALVPVPWPTSSAPMPAPVSNKPSLDAELPAADYVVLTWTVAEAAAVAAVFTPQRDAKDWYPYGHLFNSKFKGHIAANAPAASTRLLGHYFPILVQGKKVLLFKSELHLIQDGPQLPMADLVKQIMQETKAKLIITMGTAGAIGHGFRVGDVVISSNAIFDSRNSYSNAILDSRNSDTDDLPQKVASGNIRISRDQIDLANRILFRANSSQLSKVRLGFPPEPHIFWKDTPQPNVVVTTDYFTIDNTTNASNLQCLGSVVESSDAVVGLVSEALGSPAPRWLSVRAIAVPQAKGSSPDQAQRNRSAVLYKRYGFWTTVQAVIAVWAVITGSQI